MLPLLLALVASYLLGSVPAAFLVARAKGIDLRAVGSGNVGATNVVRACGKAWGIGVFLFDCLKGFVPAFLFARVLVESGRTPLSPDATALLLGTAAIVGHVFPVWLRFKGGKGVATSAGMCAGLCWPAALLALLAWYGVLRVSRYVSVASMVAAILFPAIFVAWVGPEAAFGERRLVTGLSIVLALLILYLHRANIGRLRRGEELRIGAKTERQTR
ncbi:MAG: glycerol-3-phosphate 1-O-acyltransferase PlsY [Planctomycetota bacterium JB042]